MKVLLHNYMVKAYRGVMAQSRDGLKSPKTLILTDPRAIRAIAHEARQQVLDELYSGSVLTATQAAQICGLSPSAMSYHLRALEKWGIVVRDDASNDARERPWRAAASSWNVRRSEGSSTTSMRQATNALISTFMIGLNKAVDAWQERPSSHARGFSVSRGRLYLTDEEAVALNRELDELLDRYEAGRTSRNKPVDASPREGYWLLLPHATGRTT